MGSGGGFLGDGDFLWRCSKTDIEAIFMRMKEDTTADSGYCSEKNIRYLSANNINPYIKLQIY